MKKYYFIFALFSILFYIMAFFYGVTYFRFFMRDFERKSVSNVSLAFSDDGNLPEDEQKMIAANVEGRDDLMGTASRGILLNIFFSLLYYYLFRRKRGYNIGFIALGVIFLLIGIYFIETMCFVYYNGPGEGITEIFDIKRLSY